MDDLTLVGVHDDGEHLVLGGAGGQRFRIRLDDALRAAVRRDRARLGQLQLESNGGLRPREIQARIRSGQTAEEIAEAAGIPVDHVRRYEGPVLAEREFIATQARGVRLRRSGPGGTATLTLGDLVLQRLDRQDADDHDLTWDAWRDEDGHWVVCLSYGTDDPRNRAHWTYQPQDRSLQPRDDRARRLSDDEPVEAGPLTQRRLQQIRRTSGDRVYDIEADGGPGDGGPGEVRRATVDLLDTLRERRGRRQRLSSPDEEPDTGSGDDVDSAVETLRSRAEALGNPPAAHPPRSRPERASDADVLQLPEEEPLRIPEDEDLIRHRTTARPPAARRGGPPAPAERTDRGRARGPGHEPDPAPDRRPDPGPPAAEPGTRPRPGAPARTGRGRPSTSRTSTPASGGPGSARGRAGTPDAPAPGTPTAPAPRNGTATAGSAKGGPGKGTTVRGGPAKDTGTADGTAEENTAETGSDTGQPGQRRPSARRNSRRASVPSWDDILFGSRRE